MCYFYHFFGEFYELRCSFSSSEYICFARMVLFAGSSALAILTARSDMGEYPYPCLLLCDTVLGNFAMVNSGDGLTSLGGIITAFQNPVVALIGWVHYLAFDMFVGAWEVQDAQAQGLSHWYVVPCLLGTFMAGPIGLLLYVIIRTIHTHKMDI